MKNFLQYRILTLLISFSFIQAGLTQMPPVNDPLRLMPGEQGDFRIFGNNSDREVKTLSHATSCRETFPSLYEESGRLISCKKFSLMKRNNTWKQDLPAMGIRIHLVKLNMCTVERKILIFKSTT